MLIVDDDATASKHRAWLRTVSRAKLVVIDDSDSSLVPDLYTELVDATPTVDLPVDGGENMINPIGK